jgi:hypothetical protein
MRGTLGGLAICLLALSLCGCSGGTDYSHNPTPVTTIVVERSCFDAMHTAYETDEISAYVEPANLCTLDEWVAARNFLSGSVSPALEAVGAVCDPRAEQRGFTPPGFATTNRMCRQFVAECKPDSTFTDVTDACAEKYDHIDATLQGP